MVIEVSGPNGKKKIGCNSLWCFTYGRKQGWIIMTGSIILQMT
jgi:hypothetical protein